MGICEDAPISQPSSQPSQHGDFASGGDAVRSSSFAATVKEGPLDLDPTNLWFTVVVGQCIPG